MSKTGEAAPQNHEESSSPVKLIVFSAHEPLMRLFNRKCTPTAS
jgi:hypothetical protein